MASPVVAVTTWLVRLVGAGDDPGEPTEVETGPGAVEADRGPRPILGATRPATRERGAIVELVVDGWRFEFEVEEASRARLRARGSVEAGRDRTGAVHELRAIIPGRVVSVAVVAGDRVATGQPVLVVEAMKMQNELRSPGDGVVERLAVGPGETVEPGDLLMVIGTADRT
ncbi:MAG TPA: biotin/lipoyl-containing protein [Candidatus Limnocylindrales bacterium]